MKWCFHCDHPAAYCPDCNINDCACVCPCKSSEKPLGCQSWWDSQTSERFSVARQMYFRPSCEEVVDYIKRLENQDGKHRQHWHYDVPTALKHASWHGIKIGLIIKDDTDWHIWIIAVPENSRPHLLSHDKATRRFKPRVDKSDTSMS